jgi:CubicO group peptidase (beta-lactamase class C family)
MGRTRLEKQLYEWLDRAVQDRIFPGYAFAVKVGESPVRLGAGGRFTYSPEAPTVTLDACWDCASLTKVMVTTPLVMRAVDEGLLELDTEVGDIVPESGAARTTMEHLLTHTSGLPPYRDDLPPLGLTPEKLRAEILATPVQREPGREAVYSCLNFITLQTVLERQVGMSLDDQFEAFVARPAGMTTAGFRPPQPEVCAPTGPVEDWRRRFGERDGRPLPTFERGLQGVVHDPLAWGLGGASGNAGLFASIREIAAWAEWWTRASEAKAREQWTRPRFQTTRARGWDTRSEVGSIIPDSWSDGSFGHTGFTGMSLFFDPARSIFVALATNAIFPEGINPRTRWVRHLVHSLCGERSLTV